MGLFSRNANKESVAAAKEENEVICIECDKKTQKDLPSNDVLSSEGMPCEKEYALVSSCMKEKAGQVSSCSSHWDKFKLCHEQNRKAWGKCRKLMRRITGEFNVGYQRVQNGFDECI